MLKPIAIVLDEAKIVRQVRRSVIRQMHNVVIGMKDGDAEQLIYSMQDEQIPDTSSSGQSDKNKPDPGTGGSNSQAQNSTTNASTGGNDLNVATKGKGKGKSKGYGQCWHCGE